MMKKIILPVLVFILALASMSLASDGTWTTKADMPTARIHLSTSVVDGKIYAIGGGSQPNVSVGTSTVEEYDPMTDTWTTRSPMPTARWLFSTAVIDGKIYAVGGARGAPTSALRTVEEYDPMTDTWTTKSPMPTARTIFSTAVVDGKIYAMGGMLPTSVGHGSRVVQVYDPATDSWASKASMNVGRYALGACVVNGKIYAMGGVTSYPSQCPTAVEEYDPATDTWTTKGNMPSPKANFGVGVVNGKIYAIGGGESHPDGVSPAVYEYDPTADTWTTKADMPTARTVLSASVVNGKIYAIGGTAVRDSWDPPLSTVEEYYPNPLVVDFNGDGIVDSADMCILVDHWHLDNPLCDIAPLPLGDGIVDVQDLILLSQYLFEEVDDPTLIAHWALDEAEGMTAHNNVNGNDDYVFGGALWQPDGGMIGGALEFDGIDDFIYSGTGTVSGRGPVGGLVGTNRGDIVASYSTGSVSGDSSVGGLVGSGDPERIKHSIWDTETSGRLGSAGGIGLTTAEMMDPYMLGLNGFANDPNWVLNAGRDYPRLAWEGTPGSMILDADVDWLEGLGTADNPYRIDTADQMILLGKASILWDKHFLLAADIPMDPNLPGRSVFGKALIPLFSGVFDGNGHVIQHLTIRGERYLGLFGKLASSAEVKNLGVADVNIIGTDSTVGALVGSNAGSITSSHSNGVVSGQGSVGCLVGRNDGTISDCYSHGSVSGGGLVGGLVGNNAGGDVIQCYSSGMVSADTGGCIGGLVGLNVGKVTDCYSRSGVTASTFYVGGLVGCNINSVIRCYSTGMVRDTEDGIGGLVGSNDYNRPPRLAWGRAANACFWDTETSGQATSDGGVGKTTADMQTARTFLDAGWDFVGETANGTEDIWWILEGQDYPRLWWELIPDNALRK